MQVAKLNEIVIASRSSEEGRNLILEKVATLVYEAHQKYGFDDVDDAANALLKYRGRILTIIDRFEDRGLPFDVYLASCLRYLARTVRRDRRRIVERESVCVRAVVHEADPGIAESEGVEPRGSAGNRHGVRYPEIGEYARTSKRRPRAKGGFIPRCPAKTETAAYSSRLVFLAVKCAWEIDELGVARVAAAAGVGEDWLASAVDQARRSLVAERSRIDALVERRNASWAKQILFETRIVAETDPCRKTRLSVTLGRELARCEKIKAELGGIRPIVPNPVVARILGIPKGTVDSGLYYLRKRYGPE